MPFNCLWRNEQDVFDPAGIRTCLAKLNPQLLAAENAANFLKKAQTTAEEKALTAADRAEEFEKSWRNESRC